MRFLQAAAAHLCAGLALAFLHQQAQANSVTNVHL
jgi:hypothetical protein